MATSSQPPRTGPQDRRREPGSRAAAAKARREQARRAAERRRRLRLLAIGVVVLGAATLIAVLSIGDRGARVSVDELAGEVIVDGDPLARFGGDPVADAAIGTAAPVLQGADFAGQPVQIGATGSPQLVAYMASWCPACQRELPDLVAWLDGGGMPAGTELVVVATGLDDRRPNWPPNTWLEREGYDGPVLVDDAAGTAATVLGLSATPFWVALDGDGQVLLRAAGLLDTQQLDAIAGMLAAS